MSRRLPIAFNSAEAENIVSFARGRIDAAKTKGKRFAANRDLAMIVTGLFAGGRVSELCNLQVEDVDLISATLSIRRGKGDKDRNLPISVKLAPILQAWIGNRASGYLFPGPKGRRLSPRRFQERLAELGRAAKTRKRLHPHLMRHTFATSLLRTGSSLEEVRELLGHANLQTTAIYLHVETSRLKPAVDRL
jgi:site-specific recombinase XerD